MQGSNKFKQKFQKGDHCLNGSFLLLMTNETLKKRDPEKVGA